MAETVHIHARCNFLSKLVDIDRLIVPRLGDCLDRVHLVQIGLDEEERSSKMNNPTYNDYSGQLSCRLVQNKILSSA